MHDKKIAFVILLQFHLLVWTNRIKLIGIVQRKNEKKKTKNKKLFRFWTTHVQLFKFIILCFIKMDVEVPVLTGNLIVPTQSGFSLNRISKKVRLGFYFSFRLLFFIVVQSFLISPFVCVNDVNVRLFMQRRFLYFAW